MHAYIHACMLTYAHSPNHTSIHPCIHPSCTYTYTHCTHTHTHKERYEHLRELTCACMQSFSHRSIHATSLALMILTHAFFSFIHPSMHPPIHPSIHPSMHPSIMHIHIHTLHAHTHTKRDTNTYVNLHVRACNRSVIGLSMRPVLR